MTTTHDHKQWRHIHLSYQKVQICIPAYTAPFPPSPFKILHHHLPPTQPMIGPTFRVSEEGIHCIACCRHSAYGSVGTYTCICTDSHLYVANCHEINSPCQGCHLHILHRALDQTKLLEHNVWEAVLLLCTHGQERSEPSILYKLLISSQPNCKHYKHAWTYIYVSSEVRRPRLYPQFKPSFYACMQTNLV